jgi:hypothetical protein
MKPLAKHILLASVGGILTSQGATPLPDWYGDPDTTLQSYLFTDDDLTPDANTLENPYGTPVATVTQGQFASVWQDPSDPIAQSGATSDGAWDLGVAGDITVQFDAAADPAPPDSFYRIYFHVYSIGYQDSGFVALPTFEVVGLTPNDLVQSQALVLDKGFGASYQGLLWTGYLDNLQTNALTFRLNASSVSLTVADSFEIFTRTEVILVPEPSTSFLMLVPAFAWVARRRRS